MPNLILSFFSFIKKVEGSTQVESVSLSCCLSPQEIITTHSSVCKKNLVHYNAILVEVCRAKVIYFFKYMFQKYTSNTYTCVNVSVIEPLILIQSFSCWPWKAGKNGKFHISKRVFISVVLNLLDSKSSQYWIFLQSCLFSNFLLTESRRVDIFNHPWFKNCAQLKTTVI